MATMKTKEIEISVPEIQIETARMRIVGKSPLVVHAFSEKAKRQILEKQMKTAKTKGKDIKNPVADFMDSLYWLTPKPEESTKEAFEKALANGARFGFPSVALKAAAISAAYRAGVTKNKVSLQGAFHIMGEMLEIQGVPRMREDAVRLPMGVADLRYRAEFPEWAMDFEIEYNPAVCSLEQIASFIRLGGFGCGLGENRPERGGQWGRFDVG